MDDKLNAVLAIQALRAALYGFGAVLLGEVLALQGLGPAEAGLVLTVIVAGMGVSSFVVGVVGTRLPSRSLYVGLLLLMGASGLVFATTAWLPALVAAGLTGTISTDPNESGPITTVEQGLIGRSGASRRLRLFGRYNAIAYLAGAVGSLAAAAAGALQRSGHLGISTQALFGAFPVVAVACVAIALSIPHQEAGATPEPPRARPDPKIVRLSSLFALDAFGGGFVTQAFIAYWLHIRFGAAPEQVGLVFFGAGLLQAGSSVAAARIAARAGELNVMVFTHLPSNLLLAAVALAPSLTVAVVLLLARFALSQMDVPARQAFVAGLVPPQDRLGAAAYTNLARYLGRPLGPGVGGLLMRAFVGAPFLAAGLVKIAYDVALYVEFRREKLLD